MNLAVNQDELNLASSRSRPASCKQQRNSQRVGSCSATAWPRLASASVRDQQYFKDDLLVSCTQEQEECIRETRVLSSLDSDYIIKYYDSFLERVSSPGRAAAQEAWLQACLRWQQCGGGPWPGFGGLHEACCAEPRVP